MYQRQTMKMSRMTIKMWMKMLLKMMVKKMKKIKTKMMKIADVDEEEKDG